MIDTPRIKRARAALAKLQSTRDALLVAIEKLASAIAAAVREVAEAEQTQKGDG